VYISLKDVAARSGVSFQTASKVLNGRSGVVSAQTRQRILDAARELGYVPNALARGLVSRTSLTVGVLAGDFSDLALSQFVLAAQRAVSAQGHAALIGNVSAKGDVELAVRKLREHRVDGILVMAPTLEDDPQIGRLLRGSLPVVSINHVPGGGIPVVGSDHTVTGTLAAEHLVELGHKRIGVLTGPRRRRVVKSRMLGFRTALQQAGQRLLAKRVVEADWTYAGGYAAMRQLLTTDPSVTAVFAHNDIIAVGALKALQEHGFSVPADCSLVGCDDLPFAGYLVPPLTTVQVPFAETGERAAISLLDLIRGGSIPRRELLPVRLVVRESTAPRPKDGEK
jgi:LacI family transcriptional regulator